MYVTHYNTCSVVRSLETGRRSGQADSDSSTLSSRRASPIRTHSRPLTPLTTIPESSGDVPPARGTPEHVRSSPDANSEARAPRRGSHSYIIVGGPVKERKKHMIKLNKQQEDVSNRKTRELESKLQIQLQCDERPPSFDTKPRAALKPRNAQASKRVSLIQHLRLSLVLPFLFSKARSGNTACPVGFCPHEWARRQAARAHDVAD
jgi:hypothetical protein